MVVEQRAEHPVPVSPFAGPPVRIRLTRTGFYFSESILLLQGAFALSAPVAVPLHYLSPSARKTGFPSFIRIEPVFLLLVV
jgi:hypothetical protein